MTSKRRLFVFRLVIILAALTVALGLYSPISAQEETPPPPPLPTIPLEISPTVEPPAAAPPTEAATTEPTLALPTETATLEPTAAPSTETPTLEPTLEVTVEPTLAPTSDIVTATVESILLPEATDEATAEATPDFITATPEHLGLDGVTPTDESLLPEDNSMIRVEDDLLALTSVQQSGRLASMAASAEAAAALDVDRTGQMVHIEVIAEDDTEAARVRPIIEGMRGVFLIGYGRRMEFNFPVSALTALNVVPGNFAVIQPQEAQTTLGSRTTEGVQATGAAQWHTRGFNGAGVRVGVVDIGFTGYPSTETTGCGKAISNFTTYSLTLLGDHGTNVVEIICDMAPKAEVYIAQAVTVSGLNAAVDWLISQNVNVINMSMRWDMNGVGDGSGEVNSIIQRAIDAGILWVNAAGNSNGDTYDADYSNTTAPTGNLPPGDYHNFGGSNPQVNMLFGGAPFSCVPGDGLYIDAILRWSDWNSTRTGNETGDDYSLYLVVSTDGGTTWNQALEYFTGVPVIANFNQSVNSAIPPVEEFYQPVRCSESNTRYGVAIRRLTGGSVNHLDLITWTSFPLETANFDTSISTPADSEDVLTVAAGEVKPMTGFPFSPFGYPDLAFYSSRGPILGPGGTDPSGALYPKPDITAPTNVTTSRSTAFNGTSAASPHTAGFAALVYQFNRAIYDGLSGNARAMAVRNDILNPNLFIRPAPTNSVDLYCAAPATRANCFGLGVLTLDNDFFTFTDAKMEHADGRVIRTGAGWTQQTQTGASGGNYVYTRGTTGAINNFAQIEFGVTFASGVQVFFWQRPDFTGSMEVLIDGIPTAIAAGTTNLQSPGATPVLASFTVNTSYAENDEITIRPGGGANGLSLDYVQLQHIAPIVTLQENQLSTFGTWTRTALANTSGGFHATNNQRGAGVQFLTNDNAFTITYTKRPDGGIMEIWVNGQLCTACGEVNTWSGNTMTSLQAVKYVDPSMLVGFTQPYFVQLVNSGRQTPATTSRPYIAIDNIRFPLGGGLLPLPDSQTEEAETGYTGQAGSQFLPMNGVWTNLAQSSAFGGRVFNTTTPGAEFRFRTRSTPNVVYFTGLNTGALLEIYVNGQLCAACGRIDTYRAATMYKVPYYFTIPTAVFPTPPYHVTLRNSGARSAGTGTTMTMAIDRIEAITNNLQPLDLFNVQGNDAGSFWINERWVANRQIDAIGTDVYINNSSFGYIRFNTCSTNFTVLLGKSPNGGMVRVRIWNTVTQVYDTLAEFNGQSTSTTWRYGLNVTINAGSYPACLPATPYQMVIEVDSNTQFGNALDYGYVDALLVNDGNLPFSWAYTAQETIDFGVCCLVEVGTGWATFAQPGAIGGDVRRTNQTTGHSIQFTLNDDLGTPTESPSPRLIFSRAPDGGIAEVFVNGIFQYEISFYSPVVLPQQFMPLTLPANIQYPAVVELRNVPRRTTGSTNYYLYIDAIIETEESGESGGFVAPIINNLVGTQNDDNTRIQLFGATWTRSTNPPTTTIFPSGLNIDTTTANSGGLRFILQSPAANPPVGFTFVSSTSANRGIAEVWVNGRLCPACGTINTFRAQTFWRTPFRVMLPQSLDADPGTSQLYYVEIHTTNMRSTGATAFGLSVDEIVPLDGTLIVNDVSDNAWDDIVDGQLSGGNGFNTPANWPTVTTPLAYGGSYRRTTVPGADYSYFQPAANDEMVILRNTGTAGGIAEIWVYDNTFGGFRTCFECGTINNYSPYTRYQVPFYFQIPTRFVPNNNGTPGVPGDDFWFVQIENTGTRAAGSTGFEISLDAFILLP